MFELPERALQIRDQVDDFFQRRILPNNSLWLEQAAAGQAQPEIEKILRAEAKALGLKTWHCLDWPMTSPDCDCQSGIYRRCRGIRTAGMGISGL